jgi:hypothetical protein
VTYFLRLPDIDDRDRALEVLMDSTDAVDEVVWLDSESNHYRLYFEMCWPTLRDIECDIPSYGNHCPRVSFTTDEQTTTTAEVTMQFSTKVQAANLHRSIRLDGATLRELVELEANRAYLLKLDFYANSIRVSVCVLSPTISIDPPARAEERAVDRYFILSSTMRVAM